MKQVIANNIKDIALKIARRSIGKSVPFIIHEEKVPKELRKCLEKE